MSRSVATPARSETAPPPGPVLFARYAYPPNALGLCGPEDATALLQSSLADADAELRELARGFEGAYPYLRLIGESNEIADPLDRRVVEGYWLGNRLTDSVPVRSLHRDLDDRFRGRMSRRAWSWLEATLSGGARPNHAFHVLEIFPRAGLMRTGQADRVLETMDACRIRWGRVLEVAGDQLVVAARHLELVDGRLALGPERIESVSAWRSERGPLDGVRAGDDVSLHWAWACDRLSPPQRRSLAAWTRAALRQANATT
jgi:Family of unknown function (DUF6390)